MRRRAPGRLAIAAVLAASLALTAAPAHTQDSGWPDGEYIGIFTGGGSAEGSLDGFSGQGKVVVGGFMELSILGGLADGDYELRYSGFASGAGGSGSQLIVELGTIVGENGKPFIHRQTADVSVTVDGITLNLGTRSLPPSPAPLIAQHQECQMIEGIFESKLAGLEEAFALFGIKTEAEEGFMVLRTDLGTPDEVKEEILSDVDRLSEIAAEIVDASAQARESIGSAIDKVEDLLLEVELLLADLESLALCGVPGTDFSLGISKALETFIEAAFKEAHLQGDSAAAARLAVLAARGGVMEYVVEEGAAAIKELAFAAADASDIGALWNLLLAAEILGADAEASWIVEAIEALEPSS